MEFPPAVVVGVEEKGLEEEEHDVGEKRRGEHAHQVVRELRIQDDEHERQGRSEGRRQRKGDREQLRELVGEPVVPLVSGLVADRLDDEREDGDGEDERREQQVQLGDHPDGHAAADDREGAVLRLFVGLAWTLALFSASSFSPATLSDGTGLDGAWAASWNSRPAAVEAVLNAPAPTMSTATRPRKTTSLRFITALPSKSRGKSRTRRPRTRGPAERTEELSQGNRLPSNAANISMNRARGQGRVTCCVLWLRATRATCCATCRALRAVRPLQCCVHVARARGTVARVGT